MKKKLLIFFLFISSCNSISLYNDSFIEEKVEYNYGKEKYYFVKFLVNDFNKFLKNNSFCADNEDASVGVKKFLEHYRNRKLDLCNYKIDSSNINILKKEIENGILENDWFIQIISPRSFFDPRSKDTIVYKGDLIYQFNLLGDFYSTIRSISYDTNTILHRYTNIHDDMGIVPTTVLINAMLLPNAREEEFLSPVVQAVIGIELYLDVLLNKKCESQHP